MFGAFMASFRDSRKLKPWILWCFYSWLFSKYESFVIKRVELYVCLGLHVHWSLGACGSQKICSYILIHFWGNPLFSLSLASEKPQSWEKNKMKNIFRFFCTSLHKQLATLSSFLQKDTSILTDWSCPIVQKQRQTKLLFFPCSTALRILESVVCTVRLSLPRTGQR